MNIAEIKPQPDWTLLIIAEDGRSGIFDVRPYLECEAFEEIREYSEFIKIHNGNYFIEWECGADLSTDTIEVNWKISKNYQPIQESIQNQKQWNTGFVA